MAYDLGDVATLAITVKNSSGVAENAGAVVATITKPDGTSSTPSVTNSGAGAYSITYTTADVGRHGVRWVATGANAGAYTDVFDVLDPAELPVVSLADLKAHLNITTTTDDEELRFTLAVATEAAERYCNRPLRRKTVVETHDGFEDVLSLWQAPAISVTTVVENGVTLTATDYVLNASAGLLYRGTSLSDMDWYGGTQGVVVTYVAGYTSPPLVAQQAVKELARHLWDSQRGAVGLPSVGGSEDPIGWGMTSFSIPYRVRELLDPLRFPAIA